MQTKFYTSAGGISLVVRQGKTYVPFHNTHGTTLAELRAWWGDNDARMFLPCTPSELEQIKPLREVVE